MKPGRSVIGVLLQRPTRQLVLGVAALLVAVALVVWLAIRLFSFQDPAQAVSTATPATSALLIPPLLQANNVDGVATFELSVGRDTHEFFPGSRTDTFSYNGNGVLGPTIEVFTGESVAIEVTNDLDVATTTHWHGADVPAAVDGGPHSIIAPGETWTPRFDVIQPAATLWYHPHAHNLTAKHVYSGAAGLMIVRDDNPMAAVLPQTYGVDDIPVVLQDRTFTDDDQLDFAINDTGRGRQMDRLTVNGIFDPYVEVPSGLVRLRLLNGSQARIYELSVDGAQMVKIASDGGSLEAPVDLDTLWLAPGDRAEIVVDVGTDSVSLLDANFERVVELRPNGLQSNETAVPDQLAVVAAIPVEDVVVDRTFTLGEVDGGWGINGELMKMQRVNEVIRHGDTERWTVEVENGQHVFHVHQIQFQILSINGRPPPPEDAGWEDSVWVNGRRTVELLARFDSYTNPDIPYMYHCHILDHEDLGMMGQFQVVKDAT